MIPFFVVLGVLLFILVIFILLYFSYIEIEVKKLVINSEKKINSYLIYVKLRLINRITLAKFKIDNKKIEKYRNTNNKLIKRVNNKLQNDVLEKNHIKALNIKLRKIDLKLKIGLLDPFLTSISIGIISALLSILIANIWEEYKDEKCKYIIEPIYDNKLKIKLNLRCTISIKIIHILNMFFNFNKKQNERQTNNKNIAKSKI